jgi:hypothetical protein
MSEVVVYSRRRDANVVGAQMGKIDLSITQIKNIPPLWRSRHLKANQLLPGIRNAGRRQCRFLCTRRRPDQLIMLDDAVVYNTGHLFGFFSIFNSDAIKNTSLIKGGMPAQYGGRCRRCWMCTMKDGNMRPCVEGRHRGHASRFRFRAIVQDKASFIVSRGALTSMRCERLSRNVGILRFRLLFL